MTCTACNTSLTDNFCGHCGRPARMPRVDWHYIVHEIQHVLHFEKGILFTIRALLKAPGTSIRTFITADRSRLVKPVLFIIVTSLIYSVTTHLFHTEQKYMAYYGEVHSCIGSMTLWLQGHYGYANIIMSVFIAFWLKLFFRSQGYNFFELIILLCFAMGMNMLIFAVFALLQGVTGLQTMGPAGAIGFAYTTWAIGHFFTGKGAAKYLKAFAAYILGMIVFMLAIVALGLLIDFMVAGFHDGWLNG
jgi:hypothetical protein